MRASRFRRAQVLVLVPVLVLVLVLVPVLVPVPVLVLVLVLVPVPVPVPVLVLVLVRGFPTQVHQKLPNHRPRMQPAQRSRRSTRWLSSNGFSS